MSDLYKLGQSPQGEIKKVGEEIRLDINLSENPYLKVGTVTGTITDENDDPLNDVLVKIMDNNHNPLYHGLTNEEGVYTITDIEPASDYHFYAVKDGYQLQEEQGFAISAGQTVVKDSKLKVDPTAVLSTITGHIVDNEGNPIENMLVTLLKVENDNETAVASTTTNEYGQAAFVNVAIGDYNAQITKQGYEPSTIGIQITEPSSIVNFNATVSPSSTESLGTINGIIADEKGAPVAEAVVILYEVTGTVENPIYKPLRYTRTSSTGAYLFGDVPQGDYIVKANKES